MSTEFRAALITVIMGAIEGVELWQGWNFGVGSMWVESGLFFLAPFVVYFGTRWAR